MRRAFAEALVHAARRDPRLVFLTGDLGFGVFDEFRAEFGPRYVNVGVAEALLVDAAAGLAREGWHPVAYSIASFVTARAFEQVRFAVGYEQLPVVVVGAGRGLTYATSGVSHHATDDIGLMGIIPGMTVVVPGDPGEVTELFPQALEARAPAYFSVGKYGEPVVCGEEAPRLGRIRLLRGGSSHLALVSVGEMAPVAIEAADLLAAEGTVASLYQIHTPKPLDLDTLAGVLASNRLVVILEEHVPSGGVFAAVAAAFPGAPVQRIGLPDRFLIGNLERDEVRRRLGYDAPGVAARIRSLLAGTG